MFRRVHLGQADGLHLVLERGRDDDAPVALTQQPKHLFLVEAGVHQVLNRLPHHPVDRAGPERPWKALDLGGVEERAEVGGARDLVPVDIDGDEGGDGGAAGGGEGAAAGGLGGRVVGGGRGSGGGAAVGVTVSGIVLCLNRCFVRQLFNALPLSCFG